MIIFKCHQEIFLNSLKKIFYISTYKKTPDIFNTILLKINQLTLMLTASNLETEIITKFELIESNKNDIIGLSSHKLFNIINNLPQNSIITMIKKHDNVMTIICNNSEFHLNLVDIKEFPTLYFDKCKIIINMFIKDVLIMIKKVKGSMAKNDFRYFLNGMLWDINNNDIFFIATDGHRMSITKSPLENNEKQLKIIVSRKSIIEIEKLLSFEKNNMIKIEIGTTYLSLIFKYTKYTTKLINANYPKYQDIIPKNNKMLIINRLQLKEALIRTAILSNEIYKSVSFNLSHNKLLLISNNTEKELAKETIDIQYNNTPMNIGFNINYLLDVINQLSGKNINMYFENEEKSVLIHDQLHDPHYMYIISPVRL